LTGKIDTEKAKEKNSPPPKIPGPSGPYIPPSDSSDDKKPKGEDKKPPTLVEVVENVKKTNANGNK